MNRNVLTLLQKRGKSSLIEFEEIAKTIRTTMKKLALMGFVKLEEEYMEKFLHQEVEVLIEENFLITCFQ